MSTACLLFCSTWLREYRAAPRRIRLALPAVRAWRGRAQAGRMAELLFAVIRRGQAGSGRSGHPHAGPAQSMAGAGASTSQCARVPFLPLDLAKTCRLGRGSALTAMLMIACPAADVQAQSEETTAERSQSLPANAEIEERRRIGGDPIPEPCIVVDIAGHTAGHLDCATLRLQEAANLAQSEARAGIDAPVPRAGSPDTEVGVAHEAATRLRMGSALGHSVTPERPVRPPQGVRP